jgi:DNA-binding NarL/FixJ family response regulator
MNEILTRRFTVYLVDVHATVREDLARAIDDTRDLVVVGQTGSAAEALAETRTAEPDVVLVDLDTPDRDGIELVGALRAQLPRAKLLVLISVNDERRLTEALRAGAHGYLIKTEGYPVVFATMRGTVAGGAPISASIASVVAGALREPPVPEAGSELEALTESEWWVLQLLIAGVAREEISRSLDLSVADVQLLCERVHTKLGRESVLELTRRAGTRKKRGPPPAAAAASARVPGPRPPSLVDSVDEPDDEAPRPRRR